MRRLRSHHARDLAGRQQHADPAFFGSIVDALSDAKEVLVVGPSTAKLDFLRFAHAQRREFEPRIVGVETVDHPTDGQLVQFARRYFRAADRMLG